MKLPLMSILLSLFISTTEVQTSSIIRDLGLSGFLPQMDMIENFFKLVQQAAAEKLSKMDMLPEMWMTTPQIIEDMGYPAETHHVTTDDGYILEVHRIPNNPLEPLSVNKHPVFILHGLLQSSDGFVKNLNESFALLLADAGYDVWLGNLRGNTYSKRHTHLLTNDTKFWKFSFDEMAAYDLPAMIDYVLNTTGHQKLNLVAYSLGTTVAFAMLSTKTEYNKKISTLYAIASGGSMAYFKIDSLRFLFQNILQTQILFDVLEVNELLPNSEVVKYYAWQLCRPPNNDICVDFLSGIGGRMNRTTINEARLPINALTAGCSIQTIIHLGQALASKKLQHYDWGYFTNILKYGTIKPPLYNMSAITVPTAIFYGSEDLMAPPEAAHLLAKKLKNVIGVYEVGVNWNHFDMLWSTQARDLFFDKLIKMINQREVLGNNVNGTYEWS